ncbi:hypothetical protein A0Y59_07385 [Campylobacter lari]|uniref:Uncharacterized protein n=1 Tax=Campylobacter lari TaxID=201 RepID=A0A7U8G2M0_CAMLA|nr:hypothetical protein [Campylobacter lari]
MTNTMEIVLMGKEKYYKKFKNNHKIRFLFGYSNGKEDDYFEMSLRVWINEKYFKESFENHKAENILNGINLFIETDFFKELEKQVIEIDFEEQEFFVPKFFKENNIEIIPYFNLYNEEIKHNVFFSFLRELKIKELKYLTTIVANNFHEDEIRYFYK